MKRSGSSEKKRMVRGMTVAFVTFILLLWAAGATAAEKDAHQPLRFITRLAGTGSTDMSDPEGYEAYSSIHLDASLRWPLSQRWAAEVNLAHESREVDFFGPEGEISLGSMELLPVNLLVQYHPACKRWRPYIGAGINYTLFWEKSGELNRKKLSPSFGPGLQLGADLPITSRAALNIDLKFLFVKTDWEGPDKKEVSLKIHPTVLGIGLGFEL